MHLLEAYPQKRFKAASGLGQMNYWNSSFAWSGATRLEGLGQVPYILTDAGLGKELEDLIRGAASKAMKEQTLQGLGRMDERTFKRALYMRTLQGLANGDIEPMSKAAFNREMNEYLLSGQLGGFFDKLVKPLKQVKKAIDKVTKPIRHKIEVAVKKVAPVVVAGAVTYFTGGAGVAVMKKYSGTIGQYWKSWDKSVGKVLGQAPPANPPEGEQVQYFTDPTITDAAVPMAQYQLAQEGIDMNSPQAQQMLAAYIRGQQLAMAEASGNPNLQTGVQNTTPKAPTAIVPTATTPPPATTPIPPKQTAAAVAIPAAAALLMMMA